MKTFFIGLLLFSLVFAAAFFGGQWFERRSNASVRTALLEQGAFRPTPYPVINRPFVLVLTGRNHGPLLEKTIRSITTQNYDAYRIIYIDDASDDGSLDLAKELFYESGQMHRVTLLQTERPVGELANLIRAVQSAERSEIIVPIEGDGWLAHEWVLPRLNQYYAHPDLWMTYSQYREYPTYELKADSFHLKSFYAALFTEIREADLKDRGEFLKGDKPYMLPMLEMAKDHSTFVPEVMYISAATLEKNAPEEGFKAKAPYEPLSLLKLEVAP